LQVLQLLLVRVLLLVWHELVLLLLPVVALLGASRPVRLTARRRAA
jgi:hypothetical protein